MSLPVKLIQQSKPVSQTGNPIKTESNKIFGRLKNAINEDVTSGRAKDSNLQQSNNGKEEKNSDCEFPSSS